MLFTFICMGDGVTRKICDAENTNSCTGIIPVAAKEWHAS